VIIDLDPPEDGLAVVRAAAWATKALFDELELKSVPVATGSKGYHVTALIDRTVAVPEVDEFGQLAAALLAHRHPEELTTEFRKANRGGRVFCDWLRNRWGSTSVAPWSLRPRSRPTVAVPITWKQLDEIDPDGFELGSIPETDQLRKIADAPSDMMRALQTLRHLAAEAGVQLEPFDRFRS
jgi:bifunctional non-homologous end joining protein LigD